MTPTEKQTRDFVVESNRIEGILRLPTAGEIMAHVDLWALKEIDVLNMQEFVHRLSNCALGGLRKRKGMDIRVGAHVPPPGGSRITHALEKLLDDIDYQGTNPYTIHQRYEHLHPFMDGNGRSGRALWAWQMIKQGWGGPIGIKRGFLHQYYYQSFTY